MDQHTPMVEEVVSSEKNDRRVDVTNARSASNDGSVDQKGADRSLLGSRAACEECAKEVVTARRVFFEEFVGRVSPKGRDLLGGLFGVAREHKAEVSFPRSLGEYSETVDRFERQLDAQKSMLRDFSVQKNDGMNVGEAMKVDILMIAVAYRGMQGDRKAIEYAKMTVKGEEDRALSYLQNVETWFSRKTRAQQMRIGRVLSEGADLFVGTEPGPGSMTGDERKLADAAGVGSRVALGSEAVSASEHDVPEIDSLYAVLLADPQTNLAHLDAVCEVGKVEVVHVGEPPLTAEQVRALRQYSGVQSSVSPVPPVRPVIALSAGAGGNFASTVLRKKNVVAAVRSNEYERERSTSGGTFGTRLADLIQWDGFRFREQVTGELKACDLRVEEVLGTVSAGSKELLPHVTKAAFESVVLANAKIGLPDDIRSLLAGCWEPLAYVRVSDLYDVTQGVVCEAEGVRVELSNRTEDLLRDVIARVESASEGDLRKVITGLIDRASVSGCNETLGDLMRNIHAAKVDM